MKIYKTCAMIVFMIGLHNDVYASVEICGYEVGLATPWCNLYENQKIRQQAYDFMYALESREMIAKNNGDEDLLLIIQGQKAAFQAIYDENSGNVADCFAWTAICAEIAMIPCFITGLATVENKTVHNAVMNVTGLVCITAIITIITSPILSFFHDVALIRAKAAAIKVEKDAQS